MMDGVEFLMWVAAFAVLILMAIRAELGGIRARTRAAFFERAGRLPTEDD